MTGPMSPVRHYLTAGNLLSTYDAMSDSEIAESGHLVLARAQVHATLAQVPIPVFGQAQTLQRDQDRFDSRTDQERIDASLYSHDE